MGAAMKLHNEILRNELKAFNGYEVKTVGDGFMVSFQLPTAALLWSLSIQSILSATPWPAEILYNPHGRKSLERNGCSAHGLSVRIGAHWGAPLRELNPVTERMDYFGDMVNRASRITSLADGGEITVSGEFLSALQQYFDKKKPIGRPDGVRYGNTDGAPGWRDPSILNTGHLHIKDLGTFNLRGLEKQERMYLVDSSYLTSSNYSQDIRRNDGPNVAGLSYI